MNQNDLTNIDFEEGIEIFRITRKAEKSDDKSSPVDYSLNYQAAIDKFKKVVDEYKDIELSNRSLSFITWSYKSKGQPEEAEEYLHSLLDEKKYDNELKYNAKMLFASLNVRSEEYELAIQIYDEVLKECSLENIVTGALYGKGTIYSSFLDNNELAGLAFSEIIDRYPDSETAKSAAEELKNMGIENFTKPTLETISKDFEVQSYPNPFNPSTTLSYYLPSSSNVKLEIYDIMGGMIKTLAANSQASGKHQVVWDGTNSNGVRVSSGIYIYRFEAISLENNEHFVKSNKLMLIK